MYVCYYKLNQVIHLLTYAMIETFVKSPIFTELNVSEFEFWDFRCIKYS